MAATAGAKRLFTIELTYTTDWWLRINSDDFISRDRWPELTRMFNHVVDALDKLDAKEK